MGLYHKGRVIAGTSAPPATDDSLTADESGRLGVTTPVRGVLSQAEFDALPEEERNKGLYVIDDGRGGGSSREVYDGEERVIGTWFGKLLYRKVLHVDELSVSDSAANTPIGEPLKSECRIVRLYGSYAFLDSPTANIYPIPFCEHDGGTFRYGAAMCYENSIIFKSWLYDGVKISLDIAIEYTKTTD